MSSTRAQLTAWQRVRFWLKSQLARSVCLAGLDRTLVERLENRLDRRFIRALNYHDTPRSTADNFRRQLEYYAGRFAPAGPAELEGLLTQGKWTSERPGLILTFQDGLRSNFEVAAPLLEDFGFAGWFFVPADFVDVPPPEQAAYAREHIINFEQSREDPRLALSWDELRQLSSRHVIGSHTRSHCRMESSIPRRRLDEEIAGAKAILAEKLGKAIDAFCWVGGEERNYSAEAARCIRDAGYRFSFMSCSEPITATTNPLQMHCTNVEPEWPLSLVKFQLCGAMDSFCAAKRRRVERLTGTF